MTAYLVTALAFAVGIQLLVFLIASRGTLSWLAQFTCPIICLSLTGYGLMTHEIETGKLVVAGMVVLWALLAIVFTALGAHYNVFGRYKWVVGASSWLLMLPVLMAMSLPGVACDTFSMVGFGVWVLGIGVALIAHWQEYRFRKNSANRDHWVETGLWRYTRYPTFSGEILVWLGLYMFVLSSLGVSSALIAGLSPLWLLLAVLTGGIPSLEQSAASRWGRNALYREYKERTSLLLILPPKI